MPILQAAVHGLASDQHRCRGILFTAGNASLSSDPGADTRRQIGGLKPRRLIRNWRTEIA
jgi:hypothetical protein